MGTSRSDISIPDYVLFFGTLAFSVLIGIYHAVFKKQKSNAEFLVGKRTMTLVPVSLSLMATTLSGISILGFPAEVYAYGTLITESAFAAFVFVPVCGFIFLPTLYNIQITTVFDYLTLRFRSRVLTIIQTAVFILTSVLYLGVVLFAPSLALSAVVDIPVSVAIVLIGGCVTLYSTVGGFQAVMWIESFQAMVMLVGLVATVIKGTIDLGGLNHALEIADQYGHHHFLDFSPSPFLRHTSLSIFFGQGLYWGGVYASNVGHVNRFRSIRSYGEMKMTVLASAVVLSLVILLACLCGLVIFATYAGCDPLLLGRIARPDQCLPYYVEDQLRVLPGLMGLFFAALFSGTLGACSGVLNAITTSIWVDFLKPLRMFQNLSNTKETYAMKAVVLLMGCVAVSFAMVAGYLGNVLKASMLVVGALAMPMTATIAFGILIPFGNKKGAFSGYFASLAILIWLAAGSVFTGRPSPYLPSSIDSCPVTNQTIEEAWTDEWELTTLLPPTTNATEGHIQDAGDMSWSTKMYSLTFILYPLLAWMITFVVGTIVSLITGGESRSLQQIGHLIHPSVVRFCRWLKSEEVPDVEDSVQLKQFKASPIENGGHHEDEPESAKMLANGH